MKSSYLSTSYFVFLLCFLVLAFYFKLWYLGLFLLVFISLSIFIHRKDDRRDDSGQSFETLLRSPVNGKIVSVKKNLSHDIFGEDLQEIAIVVPHFIESGLYLPLSGEFEYKKKIAGQKIFRYMRVFLGQTRRDHLESELVMLRNKERQLLGLQIVRCFLGLSPRIWILPGDRGKSGERFGYFPMGGVILFYFPNDYKLIVGEGDCLRARESILAKKVI